MRDYPDKDLLNFARQWPWIASDRIYEFDEVVRRPIKSLETLHAATTRYSKTRAAMRPPDPESDIVDAFSSMLQDLAGNGEDIDRLYDWAYCLTPFMQHERAQLAMRLWINTFTRFAHGKRERARHVDEDFMERLSLSYASNVIEPSLRLFQLCRATSELWLENDARKTAFDRMLWNFFLQEPHLDPSVYVGSGYRDVLVREWWRRERKAMTPEQIAGVRAEQADNVRAYSQGKLPTWLLDESVNESALLNGFPEFDSVAKRLN